MYNLFVDKTYSDQYIFDNKILLMPTSNVSQSTLFNKNYSEITSEIVKLNNEIASHFANHIFSKKIGLDYDSSKFLYYGFGTSITFLIADRLLRMSLLLEKYELDKISIPKPKYKYNYNISFLNFYYNEIEKNPKFNQWVISNLFYKNSINIKDTVNEYKPIKLRKFLAIKFYTFFNSLKTNLHLIQIRIKKHINAIPFYSFGYLSGTFDKSNEISNKKLLYNLPENLPLDFNFLRKKIFNKNDYDLINDINNSFKIFFNQISQNIFIPEYVLDNIGIILIELMPRDLNEKLKFNVTWSTKIFSKFTNHYYLTDSTTSDPLSSLYVYSARVLGKKIISCQHSAWGGYFANGALITENLVLGSHFYITFGWKDPDPNLSSWEINCIEMPSPLYSEMFKKSFRINKKKSNKILLCPGFLNRFPSIYNSSLRIDEINLWKNEINNIIIACIDLGFDVDLKFYNNNFKLNHKDLINFWLSNENKNQVNEFIDHDLRIRYILDSEKFNYDLVIWDLPAGGFAETLVTDIPTIALSHNIMHKYYLDNHFIMKNLIKLGLLFDDIFSLKQILLKVKYNDEWRYTQEILNAKKIFITKYINIDFDWEKKWIKLLDSIHNNNLT